MTTAKSYQLAAPQSLQWWRPLTPRWIARQQAAARPWVAVGQPTWSATTGRGSPAAALARCSRSMVRQKFAPTGPYTQLVRSRQRRSGGRATAARHSPSALVAPYTLGGPPAAPAGRGGPAPR